ncbi:MAG: hypothetical protein WCP70_04295 [Methanothrix sp.]
MSNGGPLPAPLPPELANLPQFCIRCGKQPYIRDGNRANSFTSSGWPLHREDWMTLAEAEEALQRGAKVWSDGKMQPATGIGFLVARSSPEVKRPLGGDLDCCRNPDTGTISAWAAAFLQDILPFYTEISPSGAGLRFFCWGHLPNELDNVFGHGCQDDLTEADKEAILTAKPDAHKKIAKGQPAFNGLELYEANRHLSITGMKLEELSFPIRDSDSTAALSVALKDFVTDPDKNRAGKSKHTEKSKNAEGKGRFPALDILDVIDTRGFIESGGQLSGPHPTEGSTTGKNLVVNPAKNNYCWMHNGINAGGDPWVWLACECGAVPWARAGAGVLKDSQTVRATLEHAVKRGLVSEEILESRSGCPTAASMDVGEALLLVTDLRDQMKLSPDPGLPFEAKYIEALAIVKRQNQPEYERIRAILKGLVSLRDLNKKVDGKARELSELAANEAAKELEEVSPDVLAEANKILDEGRGFEYAYQVWQKRHHGDENLGKGLFLSIGAQSCISSKGVHIHACGPRGSGKSDGAEKASEAIPGSHLLVGSASPKALYYLGERLPAGAVVYLDDIGWNDQAAQMFKTCTTFYREGATHTVVVDHEIKQFKTAPRIIFWLTTADDQTDEQIRDRLLRIDTTETAKHTREVIDFIFLQRKSGAAAFDSRELEVCQAIISILKKVLFDVVIPFSDNIEFAGDPRGATIFADLVSSFAIWRHRIRARDSAGAVVASYEDYKDAEIFFNAIRGHGDTKYTPGELRVLQAIKDLDGEATREMVMTKTGISKGGLADIFNGRSRDGQAKYGLLHKCPALTEEDESTQKRIDEDTRQTKRRKVYRLPEDYDILAAYGKAVYLSDETTIKRDCSSGSYEFAGSSQVKNESGREIVRKFVEYKDMREDILCEPSPLDENNILSLTWAKSGELANLLPLDSDLPPRTLCRTDADFVRTKPLDTGCTAANLPKPPLVCAKCGQDLTGKGTVEKSGKIYCAVVGCGYPAR